MFKKAFSTKLSILKTLKFYEYLGVGRDEGGQEGEYCALFSNKKQPTPTQMGTFWLSKTPKIPSKIGTRHYQEYVLIRNLVPKKISFGYLTLFMTFWVKWLDPLLQN